MNGSLPQDKVTLRRELRRLRRAIAPREHREASLAAARVIAKLPQFTAGRRVAVYLPFDGEADPASLLHHARRRGVRLFVPIVSDARHGRLRFHPLTTGRRRGAFGIEVPQRLGRPLGARWFDLMVVPLVGIDARGRRLGMGGGFYDRALEFRGHRRRWRGPLLVGFAFDCQCVESVFAQTWDVALDAAATQSGLKTYPRGPR
jgi:5-formyltetrahydrofolate cyclo-ligase